MFNKASADRRVAVVTGGSGAIGGAIAARLASDHTVVVLDRRGDIVVDLGDPVEVRRAADTVLDRYGRCDVLVHAGCFRSESALNSAGRKAGQSRARNRMLSCAGSTTA